MSASDQPPHSTGMLGVGDGQTLHWEVHGSSDGRPAVVLHGGPGSGISSFFTSLFDPTRYRIVMFDQRGCGKSVPSAGLPDTSLTPNTTQHLVGDIEQLREHLGIDRWLVLGASWGSTLGLAYAQRHPERVTEMVLGMVVTGTRREVTWITRDMGRLIPQAWQRFREALPEGSRDGDLAGAYARLLDSPDPQTRERAAAEWCAWEDAHVSILDSEPTPTRFSSPLERMTFARLVTHYWRNACFLEDDELLRRMARLRGIPSVLVHGRLDLSSPVDVPWHLHRLWPGSELVILDKGRHCGGHGLREALRAATNRFAGG